MKTRLLAIVLLLLVCTAANASVIVYSPNGSSATKPNLSAAVDSAAGKTIVVTSAFVIDDVTIPANTKLKIEKGGLITISSGKKLVINGEFEAGPYQIFNGNGKVAGLKYVNPVWFVDTQEGNQQAFDAVAANGIIELTTVRKVNFLAIHRPMTIKGTGGLLQSAAAIDKNILILKADNITIDGINIKGAVTSGNTRFNNVAAINSNGCSRITVKNCTISGKQNGVQNIANPIPINDITIQNNTIIHAGYGIVIWPTAHPAPTTRYGSNIIISGNDVRLQAGYDPASENIRGIRVSHCDNVTISGNKSLGAQLSIETWVDNRNRWAKNIEISSNTVDTWICLDNCDGGSLKKNMVDYTLAPAIHAISKFFGGASGAVCGIESVYVKNILIQRNYVANQPGNGIYIGYAGTTNSNELAISSNVTIDNNTIYRCATAGGSMAGLQLGLINNSTISNNTITECGTATKGMAINCGGQGLKPVYNLNFINNALKNNRNEKYTFRLFGFENVTIDRLISENNAGDGITIAESASSKLVLKNSVIANNAGFGIRYGSSISDALIENSTVTDNGKGASSMNGIVADTTIKVKFKLKNTNGL